MLEIESNKTVSSIKRVGKLQEAVVNTCSVLSRLLDFGGNEGR